MSKPPTPNFVLTLPLKTSEIDERALAKRLNAARQLYNACLGEALRRLDLMRQSKDYQAARKTKDRDERHKAFRTVHTTHNFNEYSLHAFSAEVKRSCWIGDHLDINTIQKVATRAFHAVKEYAFGKRGRPRFKGINRLRSVEGKSNTSGIRFKDGRIVWGSLEMSLIFDRKDKHGYETLAMQSRVKYVRLLRKPIKSTSRWFAQLILEGVPPQKQTQVATHAEIGIDVGPSTLAAANEHGALLTAFAPQIDNIDKDLRRAQRALDRSRRATNPDNYHANGTIKKGPKQWVRSSRYLKQQAQAADIQRKLAETRKRAHERLANNILRLGNIVKAEKLSYRAFQRLWGKSVGRRAPGMFIEILRRKAEKAGGKLVDIPAHKHCLSQLCHGCGSLSKKGLSVRVHECDCGVGPVQRDLYSGYLARYADEERLDISQAREDWAGAEPLLRRAVSRLNETAIGEHRLASFGLSRLNRSQSGSRVEAESAPIEAQDVVPVCRESLRETGSAVSRTPCL